MSENSCPAFDTENVIFLTRFIHYSLSICGPMRVVCGIKFQTKRGTQVARNLRTFLCLSFILAGLWVTHSVLFLSYLSVPAFVYAAGIVASIILCCYGTTTRDSSAMYGFHVLVATLTMCMALIFLIVIVTFVGMDAQQYISSGWKNWNQNLTSAEMVAACTEKLPTTDPDATNNSPGTGGHQENPIPLGCDFYYNMREQQLTIFLIVSVTSAFLSCMVCVLGFQMYEVIAGPQKDPMMEQTMGTAAGRLESLLSDEIQNEDLEGGSAEGDSDGQIFPTQLSYAPPGQKSTINNGVN